MLRPPILQNQNQNDNASYLHTESEARKSNRSKGKVKRKQNSLSFKSSHHHDHQDHHDHPAKEKVEHGDRSFERENDTGSIASHGSGKSKKNKKKQSSLIKNRERPAPLFNNASRGDSEFSPEPIDYETQKFESSEVNVVKHDHNSERKQERMKYNFEDHYDEDVPVIKLSEKINEPIKDNKFTQNSQQSPKVVVKKQTNRLGKLFEENRSRLNNSREKDELSQNGSKLGGSFLNNSSGIGQSRRSRSKLGQLFRERSREKSENNESKVNFTENSSNFEISTVSKPPAKQESFPNRGMKFQDALDQMSQKSPNIAHSRDKPKAHDNSLAPKVLEASLNEFEEEINTHKHLQKSDLNLSQSHHEVSHFKPKYGGTDSLNKDSVCFNLEPEKNKKKGLRVTSKLEERKKEESGNLYKIEGNLTSKNIEESMFNISGNLKSKQTDSHERLKTNLLQNQKYLLESGFIDSSPEKEDPKAETRRREREEEVKRKEEELKAKERRLQQEKKEIEERNRRNQIEREQDEQKRREMIEREREQYREELQRRSRESKEKEAKKKLEEGRVEEKKRLQKEKRDEEQKIRQRQRQRQRERQRERRRKQQQQDQQTRQQEQLERRQQEKRIQEEGEKRIQEEGEKRIQEEGEKRKQEEKRRQRQEEVERQNQKRRKKRQILQEEESESHNLKYNSLEHVPSSYSRVQSSHDSDRSVSSKKKALKKESAIPNARKKIDINKHVNLSPRIDDSFYDDNKSNEEAANQKKKTYENVADESKKTNGPKNILSFEEEQEFYSGEEKIKSRTDTAFYEPSVSIKAPSSKPPLSRKSSKSRPKESSLKKKEGTVGNLGLSSKISQPQKRPQKKMTLMELAMQKEYEPVSDSGSEYRSQQSFRSGSYQSRGSYNSRNSRNSRRSNKKQSTVQIKNQNSGPIYKPPAYRKLSPQANSLANRTISHQRQMDEAQKYSIHSKVDVAPRTIISKDVTFIDERGRLVRKDLIIKGDKVTSGKESGFDESKLLNRMRQSRERRRSRSRERSVERSRMSSTEQSFDKKRMNLHSQNSYGDSSYSRKFVESDAYSHEDDDYSNHGKTGGFESACDGYESSTPYQRSGYGNYESSSYHRNRGEPALQTLKEFIKPIQEAGINKMQTPKRQNFRMLGKPEGKRTMQRTERSAKKY